MAKHGHPYTEYTRLCELDQTKGQDLGTTYLNNKACKEFVHVLAELERRKLRTLIDSCSAFSLLMDGSTDISGSEQESMFLRTCIKGVPQTVFMHIGTPLSTSSENLHQFVKDVFKLKVSPESMKKFVGLGSDGNSNMRGTKSGLIARLRGDHPDIISVHCLCHRLELAYKQTIKSFKVYTKVDTLLVGLYYHYKKNNSKNKKELEEAMKNLAVKGPLPRRAGGTRWLGHMQNAIKAVHTSHWRHTLPRPAIEIPRLRDITKC